MGARYSFGVNFVLYKCAFVGTLQGMEKNTHTTENKMKLTRLQEEVLCHFKANAECFGVWEQGCGTHVIGWLRPVRRATLDALVNRGLLARVARHDRCPHSGRGHHSATYQLP